MITATTKKQEKAREMVIGRIGLSSVYLASVLFLWRFQIALNDITIPAYFILAPLPLLWHVRRSFIFRSVSVCIVMVTGLVIALGQGVEFSRPRVVAMSGVAIFFNILAIGASIDAARRDNWVVLGRIIKILLWVQVIMQITELMGFAILPNKSPPHFIFPIESAPGLASEPSHLALLLSPIIFTSLCPAANTWGHRLCRAEYVLAYISLILCLSLTAILVIGLSLAFRFGANKLIPVIALGGALIIAIMLFNQYALFLVNFLPTPAANRVTALLEIIRIGAFNEQTNTSAAVFYGGFQAALTTIASFPFGVGLQNMSWAYNLPDLLFYREILGDRNINDGSSTAFKLVVEFGYFGLGLVIFGTFTIIRYFRRSDPDLMVVGLSIPFLVTFFRGVGYFDGGFLIGFTLLVLGFMTPSKIRVKTNDNP